VRESERERASVEARYLLVDLAELLDQAVEVAAHGNGEQQKEVLLVRVRLVQRDDERVLHLLQHALLPEQPLAAHHAVVREQVRLAHALERIHSPRLRVPNQRDAPVAARAELL